jgi:hypothetical protein
VIVQEDLLGLTFYGDEMGVRIESINCSIKIVIDTIEWRSISNPSSRSVASSKTY